MLVLNLKPQQMESAKAMAKAIKAAIKHPKLPPLPQLGICPRGNGQTRTGDLRSGARGDRAHPRSAAKPLEVDVIHPGCNEKRPVAVEKRHRIQRKARRSR